MSSRTLNRKDFLVLTVSSVAVSALAACGGDDPATPGGTAGTGGSGTAGTGTAGTGTAGTTSGGSSAGSGGSGTAGTGTSGGGSGGGGAGGTGGSGGSGGSGGASGGGGSGGGGGGSCGADISVMSSGDHKHSLLVTAAQIAAGTDVTILSGGSNGDNAAHKHYVKITAADFTALKAGNEVKKKSCAGGDHEYVLKCGGGGTAPGAPSCDGTPDCGNDDEMTSACN